jgi:hypothetical protein
MATKKILTNEQVIRKLLKELHTIEIGLLRERIIAICEITLQSIKNNPKAFNSPITSTSQWQHTMEKIHNIVKFD